MRNNKLSRKRAKQNVVVQQDGTEVIASKDARQKLRRWSYEAEITRVNNPQVPSGVLPTQRVKLDSISYGSAQQAKLEVKQHSVSLAEAIKPPSKFRVIAIPHETVSRTTVNQLNGYRDMAMILDKTLELVVQEAQSIASGRSVGLDVTEMEADGDKPARTLSTIKEDFYKRAVDALRPPQPSEPLVQVAEPEKEFVPEIIEIQRAAE